ncbi:hypothetical protein ACTTAI_08655 [Rhodobacter capsulatus]|uniref:hypothetical protein n=1 Tax=Rhodobacter capsulatus TaxID=1061 RepID=UPI004026A108
MMQVEWVGPQDAQPIRSILKVRTRGAAARRILNPEQRQIRHGNGSVPAGIVLCSGCGWIAWRQLIRSASADRSLRRALRIGRAPRQERHGTNIIEQTRGDVLAISFFGRGSRGLITNTGNSPPAIDEVNICKQVALFVVHVRSLGRCCRTQLAKDSHLESMRLDEQHEHSQTRPLPHNELVQLSSHRGAIRFEPDGEGCAQGARVAVDLAGQGDGLARAA